MAYAQKLNGSWVELLAGVPVQYRIDKDEFLVSYDSILIWSDSEREFAGIYPIKEGEQPAQGYFVASRKLVDKDLRPVWKNTFAKTAEPEVPEEVTMRQAKIVLSRAGRFAQANAALESMSGQQGEEARIEWQYATVLRRDHPLVIGIGQALGMDDTTIDTLFREAAKV
jgi:PAS domain-containing protein